MQLEVEQKYLLPDAQAVLKRLASLGVQLGEAVEQADLYFGHPSRSFRETDEALRIRRVGEANVITYKGPRLDAQTKTRQEIELPLASGVEAFRQFATLLEALGFVRVFDVRKQRQTAALHWQGEDVELALDNVAGLGQFLELEILTTPERLETAQSALASLAKFLELSASERRSYLEMTLENLA